VSRLSTLLRDAKGNATVEFALVSLFFFGIVIVALDFGIYAQQNLKLGNAVEQASVVAFNSRAAQPTVNTSQISNYITAVVGGSPAVSFQCNGSTACGSAAPASKCIGAPASTGGWPTFTDPTGSGSSAVCASGATPGYYLVIRATRTYKSVVVPDKYLNNGTMQQQAVVRLS
jgi:Flp pilus assembly protein TadG